MDTDATTDNDSDSSDDSDDDDLESGSSGTPILQVLLIFYFLFYNLKMTFDSNELIFFNWPVFNFSLPNKIYEFSDSYARWLMMVVLTAYVQ